MPAIYTCNSAQSPKDFFDGFKEVCTLSIKNKKALVAAFIAYDLDNPEIVEVLLDQTYWNAIDHTTRDRIALFYINPNDLIEKKNKKAINLSKSHKDSMLLFPSSNRIKSLIPIEVPGLESMNPYIQYLLQQLGYDEYSKPKVPFIVFIKTNGEEITEHFYVEIEYKNQTFVNGSVACKELQRIIKNITLQLQNIKHENDPDKDTIFNLVKLGAKDSKIFDFKIYIGKVLEIIKLLL